MIFSSIPFLYYFLPVTLLCYLIAPKKLKNSILLLASLAFYAWGEKQLVLLFALSIFVGWGIGLFLDKTDNPRSRKVLLVAASLYFLGQLGYFKYTDFFITNINAVTGLSISLLNIALPIGISFYTFQLLSYVIDVYRKTVPAQKNLISFGAYVSMFPQLIAGPIVRYADIREDLDHRSHSLELVSTGISRFVIGLSKKVLIANVLGEICAQFRGTYSAAVLYYWLYAVAYVLQIYFDFSGYSDMAIGLGRIFGFRFMENFNYPYIAGTITDFWRRWHISLSSWFRDYVYIPLGGNRKGLKRQLINILIVWMLTGFWHGAAWNFILWGLLYACLLTVEKMGLKAWLENHKIIGHFYVLFWVMVGFILFDAHSLKGAGYSLIGLISFGRFPLVNAECLYYLRSYLVVLLLGIVGATPLPKMLYQRFIKTPVGEKIQPVLEPLCLAGLLLLVTAYLVDGSFNPFLYFRF